MNIFFYFFSHREPIQFISIFFSSYIPSIEGIFILISMQIHLLHIPHSFCLPIFLLFTRTPIPFYSRSHQIHTHQLHTYAINKSLLTYTIIHLPLYTSNHTRAYKHTQTYTYASTYTQILTHEILITTISTLTSKHEYTPLYTLMHQHLLSFSYGPIGTYS